jgi:hypothetical protein
MSAQTKPEPVADHVEETKREPVVDQTAADFFDSLTGYDEHAIKKAFDGAVIAKLGKEDPIKWMRALVFVHYKRQGEGDPRHMALNMTTGDVQAFFAEDERHNPLQKAQVALAAVLDAEDLDTAKAAARSVLNGGGGAPGEAK